MMRVQIATAVLLSGLAAGPVTAQTPPTSLAAPVVSAKNTQTAIPPAAQGSATSQRANALLAAATPQKVSTPRPAAVVRPVLIVATQHAAWGRVSFVLRGNPAPEPRHVADDIELRFAAGTHLEMAPTTHLRETGPIELREEDGVSVAHIHLICRCASDQQTDAGLLRLDIRAATTPPKQDVATVAPKNETTAATPKKETVFAPRTAAAAKAQEAEEMGQLRATLTDKLAKLNGVAPAKRATLVSDAAASPPAPVPPPATVTADQTAPVPVAPPPPPCPPPVDASAWRGPHTFIERLVELRTQIASSRAEALDVAALAEFYLANGLGHEALAVAGEALLADATQDERIRLTRDADIARLLKGEPVAADSLLLATPSGCDRPDAQLWRALAAAAARDAEGAARDPEPVAATMRTMPEPLLRGLAFRIVSGVGENLDALRAMAGALRNSTNENPEDEARHFLLQARIAGLVGDQADYTTYLRRAARFDMTVPGVIAKARLAAIEAEADGPDAAHSEEVLADVARTYRNEALGQQAAEQYAALQLKRHDYAAALAIADESAGPHGERTRESRGASLALRILRMLFVDPATAALPEPSERIALFLRYGGYTTPGEKGDDIRLAAAKLMLAQHIPDAALDTLRQLSDSGAATPDAARMLATAEAYAGDPAKALDRARALPDDIKSHRIAAEALHRMNQPLQAAHMLDIATAVTDRDHRASLLFEGQAWKDAATAYADLLRDPALPAAQRDDMAKRYALAVAMTGEAATAAPTKLPEASAQFLRVGPAATAGSAHAPPSLTVLRGALDRAHRIETLLGPPSEHQGS